MLEAKWLWAKAEAVKAEDGIIKVVRPGATYHPLDMPGLPNALAKVTSVEHAIRFAKNYGLLVGKHKGKGPDERPVNGDPARWFIDEAAQVEYVMRLIEMLGHKDEFRLYEFMNAEPSAGVSRLFKWAEEKQARKKVVLATTPDETVQLSGYRRYGSHQGAMSSGFSDTEDDAQRIVSTIINTYTEHTRRIIRSTDEGLVGVFTPVTLLGAIWWLIGDAAIAGPDSIRLCEECNTPFIVTDKRQHFCPPPPDSAASACGIKSRRRRMIQGQGRPSIEDIDAEIAKTKVEKKQRKTKGAR